MKGLKNMHVAFDIGQVLCNFNIDKYIVEIHSRVQHNIRFMDIKNVHKHLETMEKLDYLGIVDRSQYLEDLFQLRNTKNLDNIWNSTVCPNEQMLNFIVKLKSIGVKIALLSNMGPDHGKHLKQICPELFEKTIQHLSFEVGAFKPTKLFYQSFLMSNEDFAGCIYLDDVKENIIAGTKMGFESIHFDLRDFKKSVELKKRLDFIYDKITTGL